MIKLRHNRRSKEINKKDIINQNKKPIIALALALIVIIGGTYAWLTLTLNGTKSNVLRAGTLKLTLDDTTSDGINLENTVPMSDTKGLATTAYTFTLKNSGSTGADYTIYLDDLGLDTAETRMADKYVKYSLVKNSGEATTALLTTIGSNPNRILDSGTINSNTTNTYTLRIWIDSAADNAVMGTVFSSQLRVDASQSQDISIEKFSVGDYIKMTPTLTSNSVSGTNIDPSELNLWIVTKEYSDGSVDLISNYTSSVSLTLNSPGTDTIKNIYKNYLNDNYTTSTIPNFDSESLTSVLQNLVAYQVGTTTASAYWTSVFNHYSLPNNCGPEGDKNYDVEAAEIKYIMADGQVSSFSNGVCHYQSSVSPTYSGTAYLRPQIQLKSGTSDMVTSGAGTIDNPYILD